jgi:hypothetical protein
MVRPRAGVRQNTASIALPQEKCQGRTEAHCVRACPHPPRARKRREETKAGKKAFGDDVTVV